MDGLWDWNANQMIGRVLGALQFLTLLPIRRTTAPIRESAVAFPVVGALIGVSAAGIFWISSAPLGRSLAGLLATGWLILATGGLHEDGLADVADAVRAGRTRERMMEILKDSRIGAYGAIALILSIALRWQAIAQTTANPIAGLAAALTLSRTSLVGLSSVTPSIGVGLGSSFATSSRFIPIVATLEAIAILVICGFFIGWLRVTEMFVASVVVVLLARAYFVRRLGGVNGDCLGACCQIVEIINLMLLSCRPSI